jgi:hypothetical protein
MRTHDKEWYAGSKAGLEKIAKRRGLAFCLLELLQNSWDSNATFAKVTFAPVPNSPRVDMTVEDDDPDGFKDLSHAWTLFAPSEKRHDVEKRGRFNLGEKLVLAVCEQAEIRSTTGTVTFNAEGRTVSTAPSARLERGTIFEGRVKMKREDLDEVLRAARELIPPPGVLTTINGEPLRPRTPLKEFSATLPTETVDEDGNLKRTSRTTRVRVYEALDRVVDDTSDNGPHGWIYEMGIPVCPAEGPYDLEVMQKVPVGLERNSVSAGYLRTLRVLVLNEMHGALKPEYASKPAIQDALTDSRVLPAAVVTVLTHQYGEKRVTYDPSDHEANHRAVAEGYTVIPSGAFSKDAWANIRAAGASRPSGQVTPTYKAYGDSGEPAQFIPEEDWGPTLRGFATFCSDYARRLLGHDVRVRYEKGRKSSPFAANYGARTLTFNHARLGREWFEAGPREAVLDLLIHEFAHESVSNHLSKEFYEACTKLGAKSTDLALSDPDFFKYHGYTRGGR